MRKVVANTTPLIALSHVGQLELLKRLYEEIIIPEAVYKGVFVLFVFEKCGRLWTSELRSGRTLRMLNDLWGPSSGGFQGKQY